MKPILYSHSETGFTNNGLGRLADCISCKVTEERNGIYECRFTYPVTGEMYSKIQIGCILGAIHDDSKDIQPFDIYAKDAPMNGVVTFYAHHISYRLGHVILKPMTASSITGAFAAIPTKTYNSCPFTFWTDKSVSATWKVEVPSAVKAVLGGESGSILDVYGKGEYEWDKFAVKLHLNRGNDNGVSIRYGVNLSDIKQDYDISESYNAVAPYWKSEDGTLVTLTEGYIAATSVEPGEDIIPVPLDLSSVFESQPTEAQLRTEAQRQLDNSEAWIPNENISVKFIDLAHTQEYKDIAALQRVRLCDKVSVYCGPLGVSAVKMQVIKTVYNVLTEEYDEIELGTAKTSFADTIMAKVSDATGDLPTISEVKSLLRLAVDEATDQITGAQNSHVRFIYDANDSLQEIVILDTDDILTATKVWRWNSGGLGYSSNGYAGPYSLAMTQNGAIVADFITTGTLTAALIRAGVLQDVNGYNVWNLDTGEFRLASTTTVGGSTVAAIAQDKVDTLDNALTQQVIFNRLTNNGQTQGIYLSNGLLYINASYINTGTLTAALITTGTMSAARIQGGTLTLGGANNANGALSIKDASGNVIGTWDRNGISILSGSISLNNGTFTVTSGGALTANSASLKGKLQSTGTDAFDNAVNVKIVNGKIRVFGTRDGGDTASYISSDYVTMTGRLEYGTATFAMVGHGEISINCDNAYSGGNGGVIDIETNYEGDLTLQSDSLIFKDYFNNVISYDRNGGATIYVSKPVQISSSLSVTGTKNRVVSTDQYSDRLLYCYETPSPMFGDIGEGVVGEDGKCYVWLDPVFVQTISTDQYQVFLQRYGEGDIYVSERRGGCFVVTGTPGMAFGWEIKAKQKDFDQRRLDNPEDLVTIVTSCDYGVNAAQHIAELQEGRREP